ncbi:MAG: T9SS type A sorting domain-containing protein, partial [Candidatus Cloacimonetes bacterium]|nr:T9SS type A sorting domain-containing protein [Candidatus Cloacimonadota bacterium]MDY0230121.1 FlgD immunoglobulin-like domain containing protein [Candidatus Cloacimonadaceae bacterium]
APEIPAISLTAYPNPFSAFTNIKVNLQASEGNGIKSMNDASITIYNLKGQKVKSIKLDPRKPGEQLTYWDGMDADNVRCSSGIYCINLMVNGRSVSSKKVTLIR